MNPSTIINDPSTSKWLREALESAMKRDPLDALYDAHMLFQALKERSNAIQMEARQSALVGRPVHAFPKGRWS